MDQITKIDDSTFSIQPPAPPPIVVKVSDLEHQLDQCDIDLHEFQLAIDSSTAKMKARQADKDALLAQVQAASDAGLAEAATLLTDIAAQTVVADPIVTDPVLPT